MTEVLEAPLEAHRTALTGYCYRMLGSAFEADDAVQDTMVRAWKAYERFDGRSSVKTWLFKIATNVCLDMISARKRRAMPMDFGPAVPGDHPLPPPLENVDWLGPIPDNKVFGDIDPGELIVERESVRLAFVAALQHLPAKQRVVLILRDVLKWSAAEVASLLDTTAVSVNSALQRAHATMERVDTTTLPSGQPMDDDQRKLLERYVEAFERYDIETFVTLLHDDAMQSMPPYTMWVKGAKEIGVWMLGQGAGCDGGRLVPCNANGSPAFGLYRKDENGVHRPFNVHVVEIVDGKVAGITYFLDPALFPYFGLPEHPDDA